MVDLPIMCWNNNNLEKINQWVGSGNPKKLCGRCWCHHSLEVLFFPNVIMPLPEKRGRCHNTHTPSLAFGICHYWWCCCYAVVWMVIEYQVLIVKCKIFLPAVMVTITAGAHMLLLLIRSLQAVAVTVITHCACVIYGCHAVLLPVDCAFVEYCIICCWSHGTACCTVASATSTTACWLPIWLAPSSNYP